MGESSALLGRRCASARTSGGGATVSTAPRRVDAAKGKGPPADPADNLAASARHRQGRLAQRLSCPGGRQAGDPYAAPPCAAAATDGIPIADHTRLDHLPRL